VPWWQRKHHQWKEWNSAGSLVIIRVPLINVTVKIDTGNDSCHFDFKMIFFNSSESKGWTGSQ
jgi:hypothetical protein